MVGKYIFHKQFEKFIAGQDTAAKVILYSDVAASGQEMTLPSNYLDTENPNILKVAP